MTMRIPDYIEMMDEIIRNEEEEGERIGYFIVDSDTFRHVERILKEKYSIKTVLRNNGQGGGYSEYKGIPIIIYYPKPFEHTFSYIRYSDVQNGILKTFSIPI